MSEAKSETPLIGFGPGHRQDNLVGGHAADLPALPKKLLLRRGWGLRGSNNNKNNNHPETSRTTDPNSKHKVKEAKAEELSLARPYPNQET